MAFAATPRDAANLPLSCTYVPNSGITAMQGAFSVTDASSNVSSAAVVTQVDGFRATYSYAIQATAPYATPTDWVVLRGSSSKTIRVTRVELSGAATAATEVILTLKKHTVANTVGTSTNPTPTKHDSNDGAATALLLLYSVAPTIDATATIFRPVRMTLALAPAATANIPDRYAVDFGTRPSEALVLRGVAQEFAINFAGAAVPSGGVYDLVIEWTEDNS